MSALFIILVSLRMTLFSEKILFFNRYISGLMPNLIKKSWTVSINHPIKNLLVDQCRAGLISLILHCQIHHSHNHPMFSFSKCERFCECCFSFSKKHMCKQKSVHSIQIALLMKLWSNNEIYIKLLNLFQLSRIYNLTTITVEPKILG